MTDLACLGEQIAVLKRQRTEANEKVNRKEGVSLQDKFDLQQQTMSYMEIRWSNAQEMIIRKNNLEVMTFVLELGRVKKVRQHHWRQLLSRKTQSRCALVTKERTIFSCALITLR